LRERLGVRNLAVAKDVRRKRRNRRGRDLRSAVRPHFGRGDAAGLDLEPDQSLLSLYGDLHGLAGGVSAVTTPDTSPQGLFHEPGAVSCPRGELSPRSPCRPPNPTGRAR